MSGSRGSHLKIHDYSKDNSRLYASLMRYGHPVITGYFDFNQELFFVTEVTTSRWEQGMREVLLRELHKNYWEYSGNYDAMLYERWLYDRRMLNHN